MAHVVLLREAFEDLTTGVIRSWLLAHQGVTPTTLAVDDRSLRVTLNGLEMGRYVERLRGPRVVAFGRLRLGDGAAVAAGAVCVGRLRSEPRGVHVW